MATLAAVVLAGCGGDLTSNLGSSAPQAAVSLPRAVDSSLPLVSSAEVPLGTIAAGGSSQTEITLTNAGQQELTVATVHSSCPCVRMEPDQFCLAPGERATIKVIADMADEPAFAGGLGVRVELLDANKKTVGRFKVAFAVALSPETPP